MTVLLFLCSSMDSSQSLKFCKDFRLVFKLSRGYSSPSQTEGLLIACCVDFDFLWWMFSGMPVLTGFTLPDRAQGWPGGPGAEPKGALPPALAQAPPPAMGIFLLARRCWVTSEHEV